VTSAVLNVFIQAGFLTPSTVIIFELMNILGIIILIYVMPYWGTTYIVGWIIGLLLLFRVGLIGGLNFLAFFITSLVIFTLRWMEMDSRPIL